MAHPLLKNSLFIRTIFFSILFILLSGWYGAWIINTPLLYPFYFFIYGNLGKVLLFSFVAFVFIARKKLKDIHIAKYERKNIIFLAVGVIVSPLFFPVATELLKAKSFTDNVPLSLLAHAFIIVVPLLFAFGIFGVSFLRNFLKKFKQELLVCAGIAMFLYFSIFYVWTLWPYLSDIVLRSVAFLFGLSHEKVLIFEPRTLFVDRFAVTIDQACSGLESFLLFTGLSGLIAFMDRKRINFRKFILFYVVGIIGAFLVNILRVYVIIWSGLVFSPQIAKDLFHTYLGMIFFIIYFILFTKFISKYINKVAPQ